MRTTTVTLPLRIVSTLNTREHWAKRAKRTKHQREWACFALRACRPCVSPGPVVVTLTRIAPRQLDDDNNAGGLKAVRDGVADWLGVDDRHPSITWRYAQERGAPKTYAVRIEVEHQ